MSDFKERFISGCIENGYDEDFAERCFRQLEGFSGYGFPESHAASFALLVYASAWLRHHHPEVYCCAILNSQPMGFYAPAQLVGDARRHGVEVRPVDVNASTWDCSLEPDGKGGLAVRLGFRMIKGFKEEDAHWLTAARGNGYRDLASIRRRAGLFKPALERLAMADAFASLGVFRRDALWHAKAVDDAAPMPLLDDPLLDEPLTRAPLPQLTLEEDVFDDFISTRLSLKDHPIRLVRDKAGKNITANADLRDIPENGRITVLGAVITRQRPATASGVVFITLEDETGSANLIVWKNTFTKYRAQVMQGRLLKVTGKVQREGRVIHVISERIEDLSYLFDELGEAETSIDMTWSSADEVKKQIPDSRQTSRFRKRPTPSPAMHPRQQAKKLFQSRDFH